jgi:CheY-like chemotaxis protein
MKAKHGKYSADKIDDNATTAAMERPLRVLVAEDDDGIRDIFQIVLENAGYSIELKDSGKDLLQNNFTTPDLFLVDKQLPGADGIEICRHLKHQETTMHIPIIMISASPDIGVLSRQAGADGYIEKPFEIAYLLKMVQHYTRKH